MAIWRGARTMTTQEQETTTATTPSTQGASAALTTTRKAKRRRLTGRLDHKINTYRAATGIEKQQLEKQLIADCQLLLGGMVSYYHRTAAGQASVQDLEAAARVGLGYGIATWDASLCPYPHVHLRYAMWAEMQREVVGAGSLRCINAPRDTLALAKTKRGEGVRLAADDGSEGATDESWDAAAEMVRQLSDEDKALLKGAKTRAELPRRRALLERLRSVIDGCATPTLNPQGVG